MSPYALVAGGGIGGYLAMRLLVFYMVFVAIGEAIAYFVGRTVEIWSQPASLPIFLACFFFVLWGAWRLAIRVT